MKPILLIDLYDLKEYRDEFDVLIKRYERLNADAENRLKQIELAGYSQQDVKTILDILLGGGE